MRGKLVILSGPLCGESVPLNGGATAIGRDPTSQLSMSDHLMSRRHCAVEMIDGSYHLRDLGSANGTFVNESPFGSIRSLMAIAFVRETRFSCSWIRTTLDPTRRTMQVQTI